MIAFTRKSQKFCNIRLLAGVLTRSALLLSVRDLKVTQMNVQGSLIRELVLHEFELCHSAAEVNKNICCTKVMEVPVV